MMYPADRNPLHITIKAPAQQDFITLEFTIEKSKCDCGAEKVKTTHVHWCSTQVKK